MDVDATAGEEFSHRLLVYKLILIYCAMIIFQFEHCKLRHCIILFKLKLLYIKSLKVSKSNTLLTLYYCCTFAETLSVNHLTLHKYKGRILGIIRDSFPKRHCCR